jgi:micrococcal nuclease
MGLIAQRLRGTSLPPTVTVAPVWKRRPLLCAAIAALALLSLLGRDGPGGDDYDKYHNQVFHVVYVADGDTFDVDIPDGRYHKTRIRLWGVDTPEVEGSRDGAMHYGAEAAAFAKETLLGKSVRVLLAPSRTRDKYNRLLAYVAIEESGESFNELLLSAGHAYADWRFRHPLRTQYKSLERRARRQGIGLWADIEPEQMPAWRQRMERELDYQPP